MPVISFAMVLISSIQQQTEVSAFVSWQKNAKIHIKNTSIFMLILLLSWNLFQIMLRAASLD